MSTLALEEHKLSPVPDAKFQTGQASPRVRLDYLDGMRALAAIYVCLFHLTLTATWTGAHHHVLSELPFGIKHAAEFLRFGHFAVSVFIILSGYCLMLPAAVTPGYLLSGGTAKFLWRRTRRIIPPYYAALTLCLMLALVPGMDRATGARMDETLPAWEGGAIFSHLLLIQNWSQAWFFKINAPAWSVAPEWQIYWLFPFVLLPMIRRIGMPLTTLVALGFGAATHRYFHGHYDFIGGGFVGLFALGMLGATISFSQVPWANFVRQLLPWGFISAVVATCFVGLIRVHGPEWLETHTWLLDPVVGVATLGLLISCTRSCAGVLQMVYSSVIIRALQARWLVWFGGLSYSFYLVHDPVLHVMHRALREFISAPAHMWIALLIVGGPVCVSAAYLFHLAFERPFMPGHPASARQASTAAIAALAP